MELKYIKSTFEHSYFYVDDMMKNVFKGAEVIMSNS